MKEQSEQHDAACVIMFLMKLVATFRLICVERKIKKGIRGRREGEAIPAEQN